MFLRPSRWGKSAFLDMLCDYYDLHKANIFNDLFGPLCVGKHPTPWRNKHLVLRFDLSAITAKRNWESRSNGVINDVLEFFVEKYAKELGFPKIRDLVRSYDASSSLNRVLVSQNTFL